jgi:hypothetical protein
VRLVLLIIGTSVWAAAGSSVNDVVALVRSAIEHKRPDAQVAKALHKMDLMERLDGRVVEELESAGAGPMTVAALEQMRTASQRLKKPSAQPQFASPPEPSPQEQVSIIAEARKIGLVYSSSLPDFICTEVIRRYLDPNGKESWKLHDTLTVDLSFFKQHEEYKLLAINNRPTYKSYESAGGQVSEGEFGSLLGEVFQPASKTDFVWDHWTTLRKRPAYVFFFRVSTFDSNFTLEFRTRLRTEKVVTGARGFVYVDRDTHMVMRIAREAESLPRDFPVQQASSSVDYGFTEVGGRPYLLPLRAASQMQHLELRSRNEVEFQRYRKFSGEANISFGDVPATDDKAPAPVKR